MRSAASERGVGIAAIDRVAREDVVGRVGVEHGGQLRGPRHGPAARLAERRLIRRGDERQGLSVVLDLTADRDEDRLVALDRADDVVARDVVGGDDHDLRPVEVGIEVERIECGVRVARADRGAIPGTRDHDVIGVEGQPGELLRTLAPQRHGRAGATGDRRGGRDDERIGHVRPGRHAHRRYHRSRTTLDRTHRCDRAPRIGPTPLSHGPNALGRPYHPGHSRPARGRCPVYRG